MPTARQSKPQSSGRKRAADRHTLAHAFLTFTQAAGSLEKSYAQLQGEVARLRSDLESANEDLSRSLEETSRVRVFLSRVLEHLPCGVVVTDDRQRPRMANPEARRLFDLNSNWNPENDDCPAPVRALLAEVDPETARSEREWDCPLLGEQKVLGVSATHVENAPNGSTETIWILRDISEQKRAAAERETARRARALADISTVLAHEIRNPLGSMELFTGLLAGATRELPEANEWVIHLQAGVRLLAATVNNVLQFHTQPCGTLLPISLDRLLRETTEFIAPLARQRGIAIVLRNRSTKFTIAADAHRLQQVFSNLSLNAFHAMPSGGVLTVEADIAEDSTRQLVRIDFQDEGCGIEPSVLGKIFEPGFTTKAGSPGLGLAVCKSVVEQHGGSIRVQSIRRQGTTFSVQLPLLRGPE